MPRLYTVEFEAITLNAAGGDTDIFEFTPGANTALELLSVELAQSSEPTTEEEQLRLKVIRGHTTAGSAGAGGGQATPTPRPISPLDAAASFSAKGNNATIASAGTAVNLWSGTWNTRQPGPLWAPLPQGSGFFSAGSALLVLRLMAAVADDITAFSGTAYLCEYP